MGKVWVGDTGDMLSSDSRGRSEAQIQETNGDSEKGQGGVEEKRPIPPGNRDRGGCGFCFLSCSIITFL
jgi:hypothetical protein